MTFGNARFWKLSESQRDDLRYWRSIIDGEVEDQRFGLWACGDRFTGSSYVAEVPMQRLTTDHPEWDWRYYNARDLMEMTRTLWDPADSDDGDEVTHEWYLINQEMRFVWDRTPLLWIDQLHESIDMRFWLRHVQPLIERRVRERRATIVATEMAPNHPELARIQRVIEGLFVIVQSDYVDPGPDINVADRYARR